MWLYPEYANRVPVEISEELFLREAGGFWFGSEHLSYFDKDADINDLKFSRVIDRIEEPYSLKKDFDIIFGVDCYYPDDNCFCVYYNTKKTERI